MFRRSIFLSILVPAFVLSCSSGDGGHQYPETLCEPGDVQCFSNYLGTCQATGKGWDLFSCGASQYCDLGACRTRACSPPGKAECKDEFTSAQCNDIGSAKDTTACGVDQKCFGGACLRVPCEAGLTRCEYQDLITCTGGTWKVDSCPAGQACKADVCAPQVCTPEEARCATDAVAILCNLNGTDWTQTPCPQNQHCVNGFCFPIVANPPPEPVPDVPAIEDGWGQIELPDVPTPEYIEELPSTDVFIPGQNKAMINGSEVKFLQLHDSDWIAADQMLMINLMSKKMDAVPFPEVEDARHNVEIRITGIVEGQLGSFACDEATTYTVQVWYRYGKYAQGEECKDFDYQGTTCAVVLEEFGVPFGRIVGTFDNVELQDCKADGTTVQITGGLFDVER
ncbi:MAG: hypothetical protein ISR64_04680 [Deltaproteobacteria bacterium]|nr:hypothetical protein [Deltaproteobacteria bacterium]